ncbi:tetratricopeptide repeat protein [Aliikangiella sp. G2MR2-5]|uniref:tetratricopeptide repeat protein n=1 Tax=Aliikangiella sp. G2MR2-5 TaxID=2788943 RepID=UPI0018A9ECB6|nr:tetratricopeptide repeat protein [Aliikangiella sp. G2MR2-5]
MKRLSNQIKIFLRTFFYLCAIVVVGCQSFSPGQSTIQTTNNSTTREYHQKFETALAALKAENFDSAEELFIILAKEVPNKAGPVANLGLIRFIRNKQSEARNFLEKAIKIDPNIPQAHNLLGLISIDERKIIEAEQYLKKAIELKEGYSNAHFNLALLYEVYLQDNYNAAKHYKKYLETAGAEDSNTADWLSGIESAIEQAK